VFLGAEQNFHNSLLDSLFLTDNHFPDLASLCLSSFTAKIMVWRTNGMIVYPLESSASFHVSLKSRECTTAVSNFGKVI